MIKEYLIQSAAELSQPGTASLMEFMEKEDLFLVSINEHFQKRADLNQLIGEGNLEMMRNNHHNHLRFMASLFGNYQPDVLVETVLWVFRAYRSHGFRLAYWPAQLDTWVVIFKKHLKQQHFSEIYPFYNWMIVNNPLFAKLSDPDILKEDYMPVSKHD